jgi:hypothetical protein
MSALKSFLEMIDPNRNIVKIEKRNSEAFISFDPGSWTISSVEQFRSCMSRFYWHMETYGTSREGQTYSDPDYIEQCGVSWLFDLYGTWGLKVGFEIASGGLEGGLYQILKDITAKLTQEQTKRAIDSRVSHFLEGLSSEERLEAAEEYIRDYGHLLPSNLAKGEAWRLNAVFHEVLSEHPHQISRMRQLRRS